jgi:hypothetical protein
VNVDNFLDPLEAGAAAATTALAAAAGGGAGPGGGGAGDGCPARTGWGPWGIHSLIVKVKRLLGMSRY